MLLIDIRSTNASAAEFMLYRLKLYLAGRHYHHTLIFGLVVRLMYHGSIIILASIDICFASLRTLNLSRHCSAASADQILKGTIPSLSTRRTATAIARK